MTFRNSGAQSHELSMPDEGPKGKSSSFPYLNFIGFLSGKGVKNSLFPFVCTLPLVFAWRFWRQNMLHRHHILYKITHTKREFMNKFEIICDSRVFFNSAKRPNPIFYFFVFPAVRRKHTEYQYTTRGELKPFLHIEGKKLASLKMRPLKNWIAWKKRDGWNVLWN